MKTVEEIRTSLDSNKNEQFLNVAREYAIQARGLAEANADVMFIDKMAGEVISEMRKCESADCEYSAYAYAHAAEVWFNKIRERV